MKSTTVWIQDLDGRWEQVGSGTLRGLRPSNAELTSDGGGPKQATFDLLRLPWVAWPDIQAYAPVEIEIGAKTVWKGRIVEAPTSDETRTTTVRCEGIQSHLDDDQYSRGYIFTDITQWVDIRSALSADLTTWTTNGQVDTGSGRIVITVPKDTLLVNTKAVGVALDLGPDSLATSIYVDWSWKNDTTNGNQVWNVWGSNDGIGAGSLNNVGGTPNPGTGSASGFSRYSFSIPCRYIHIGVQSLAGSDFTPTGDLVFSLNHITIYTDSAYESSSGSNPNAISNSALDGSEIVKDALDKATILFSADRSQIDSASAAAEFFIPEFAPDGPRTPRQVIDSVNAFYDYLVKVDERGRVHFRPRPTVPAVKVGRWGSSSFNDASASSAEDVFNKVIVSGKGPANDDLTIVSRASELSGVPSHVDGTLTLTDPSFGTAVTHWSDGIGTNNLSRTTTSGEFETSPAAMKWDSGGGAVPGGNSIFTNSFATAGTFYAGLTYRLDISLKASAAGGKGVNIRFGTATDYADGGNKLGSTGTSWSTKQVSWTPTVTVPATSVGVTITVSTVGYRMPGSGVAVMYYIDSLAVSRADPTIIDKRGFVRTHTLDSSFMLTPASADRLGDLYLQAHRYMPFKGSGQVVGSSGLRGYSSGNQIEPEDLLLLTGELMHFDDRVDPDTGAVGRDGRLVQVVYRPDTDTATFDIDNTRGDFDELLARVGVKVGQIRR